MLAQVSPLNSDPPMNDNEWGFQLLAEVIKAGAPRRMCGLHGRLKRGIDGVASGNQINCSKVVVPTT